MSKKMYYVYVLKKNGSHDVRHILPQKFSDAEEAFKYFKEIVDGKHGNKRDFDNPSIPEEERLDRVIIERDFPSKYENVGTNME